MRARICCLGLLRCSAPMFRPIQRQNRRRHRHLPRRSLVNAGAGGRIRTCEAFRRRFYRPVVLATHPPRHSQHLTPQQPTSHPPRTPHHAASLFTSTQTRPQEVEPKGGFEPPTCRLQIGCAANCATWACLDPKPKRPSNSVTPAQLRSFPRSSRHSHAVPVIPAQAGISTEHLTGPAFFALDEINPARILPVR